MRLVALRRNVFCIRSFVNIGVIANDQGEAILVDAGLDERVARRVKSVLDENHFKLKGIVITHAHADHYGGACYLSETLGARIYSSKVERGVVDNPILEALCLFGGAYPPTELRRKFFHAPEVAVHGTVSPGKTEIEGFPVEIVDLSGHTIGQIGIAIETVLFCADSIATPGQIKKQGILKNSSIEQSLQTLERLKSRNDLVFVPSHGEIYSNIRPLVAENQELINATLSVVLRLTNDPIGVEDLIARICTDKFVTIKSLAQYYVIHLSILAYLGCLLDRSQISVNFRGNKQLFQRRSVKQLFND